MPLVPEYPDAQRAAINPVVVDTVDGQGGMSSAPTGPIAQSSTPDAVLAASPLYQQYWRRANIGVSDAMGGLAAYRARQRARLLRERGFFQRDRERGTRAVQQDYESRGLAQAGGRLRDIGEGLSDSLAQQRKFESGVQDDLSERAQSTASEIARIRRSNSEDRLAAADDLTRRTAGL